MEKMANGEGYKDLLVDVYGMLETGVNILGGLLDNLDKIAIATAAILLMTKGGSVLGGISHIAGGYGNFARGFAGGVYNTIGGIGNFLMHPISTIKGGVGNLSQFANAQQIYQYGAAVNRGAHKLGYANIDNLGLGLNGAAFTGNVFSPTDLNASTRFLTNSSVYGLFGGMNSGQINGVFNNALMGLNNPQIAQAYTAYSQALQQGVTDETQLSNLRQQLKQSFANTDMASDQAAQQLLEFSAQTGMTGDQLAGSALIMRQNAVNGNVPMAGTPAKGLKGFTQSNLGRQLGNVGMMAGSMVGMMGTSAAIKEAGGSDTTAMVGSMAVSGIAMLGPWGALIAGVLGAGGALYSWLNESQEEILEAAQKAEESLSDLKSSVEESQKNVTQLESQETRWNELIKGVDSASGKNISLSDAEWSEYQEILSSIIDSRNDLYASYDEEGNIIAKNAQSVMNLNDAMSESIKIQQEKLRAENEQIATKKDEDKDYTQAKILRGQYVKMFKEYQEDYEAKEDSAKMLRKDADKQWEKFTKKWTKDKAEADPKGYAADLRKWSMDYGMVASAAEDEFQEFSHKVQLEISDLMKPYVSTMLQGNESYVTLDKTSQSFILDQIFGSYNINPSQSKYSGEFNSQEQWNKDYEKYLNYANTVSEWAKNNPLAMQQLSGYNFNTSGATASSQYEQALYQMLLANFKEEDIPTVLKHMGFSNIKVDNGNIQADTQYEYFTNLLLKEGFNSETLKSLTGQELSTLYRTRDNFKGFSGDIVELRNQLKELTLGEAANASEYFASLASELGLTTANTKELIEVIQSGNADGSFGLSKLQEIADNLGVSVETLVENISILGDINSFGQTEKSLSEIETQFEHIDAISQDLSDNGMISAENLETLINEFPELVQYVDDFDTLLSKLQDMGDLKTIKIQASIAGSIADSDKVFEEFISQQLGDNLDRKIDLGMFGNLSNLQTMTKNLYDIDEQGNATLKSFYQNMALRAGQTDSGTYADNSWAKFVAENRYNIDTSKGTVDEVNQKLYQAMKSSAISSGLSEDGILDLKQGGLTQLLQLFQNQMTNNPQYLLALQGVATAEANLKAGKAAKQVENEEWEKNLSKAISDLKDDYDSGRIGIDNYIAGMEQLSKHSKITKEQLKELQESVEDAKFEKLSKQFEDGAISASKYRSELSALMKQNAFGSDDYNKYRDAFLSTFDSELDKLDGQKSLLYEKDYSGQRSLLNRENVVLTEKLAALEAAGLKNTKDYLDVLERIKTNKEEQLEIDKQELEYQKEQLDNTMSAYNTLADYAIKQLEKERDLVEERYDEEIDKLQEVNDQKERSIELTKLQQELENAQKEKSRVYVGGIGFTYQANQAKIDEAEKNLEDYLADRKISDLGNAKERDLKYYEDQIDFWNEVKEMVEDVQTLASTEDAIRQLIKDGILPSGATIPSSLETLRQNVKLDSDGHVLTLGKKFDVIRTQYLDNAKRLWKVNAEWETNLKNIANVMSGFKNSEGMVEQFKSAFVAGVEALDITVETPENTVDLSKLEADLATAKGYLNTVQSNIVNLGKVTVGSYVSKTKSDGVWGDGKYFNKVVTDTVYNGTDGNQYYQFTNSEKGTSYLVKTSDIQYDAESGNFVVKKGAAYYNMPTFSSGLEAGVMAHTGLAMLHGTPQKPEYVLNNDQAWTLLKNFATLSLPAFDRKSSNKTINYQFYGDLHLPNVQDPSTFFEELLRQSSSQFNITQSEY